MLTEDRFSRILAVVDAEGTQTFDVLDGEVTEDALEERLIDKADVITSSASGDIVTIQDGAKNLPVKNLSVSLLPVQDLHGQANPYPAGGGKNMLNVVLASGSANNVTWTVNNNGTVAVSSSGASSNTEKTLGTVHLLANTTYILNGCSNPTSGFRLQLKKGTSAVANAYNNSEVSHTPTEDGDYTVTFVVISGNTAGSTLYPMIRLSSVSDGTFAPYSNICPISGWTGVEVDQGGSDFYTNTGITSDSGYYVTTGDHYLRVYNTTTSKTFIASRQPLSNYNLVDGKTYVIMASVNNVLNGVPRIAIRRTDNNQVLTPASEVIGEKIYTIFTYDASIEAYLSFFANWSTKTTADVRYSDIAFAECKAYPIDWSSSAGTVYGGSLDLTTGVLTVDKAFLNLTTATWSKFASLSGATTFAITNTYIKNDASRRGELWCDRFKTVVSQYFNPSPDCTITNAWARGINVNIRYDALADLTEAEFKQWTIDNNLQICWGINPTTYQLTPSQISTFLGMNNFWSNSNGQIDLEYRADTKLYIEQLTKPTEDDMTANQNITASSFFMVGNRLFLSTVAIAQGATIIPGTNCTEISLADALNQINA